MDRLEPRRGAARAGGSSLCLAGSTGSALRAVRPSNLHITPVVRRGSAPNRPVIFKIEGGQQLLVLTPWRDMPNWPEKGMQRSMVTFERSK